MRGGFASELHDDATWPLLPHLKHVIARCLPELLADLADARREFSAVVVFESCGGGSRAAVRRHFFCGIENLDALACERESCLREKCDPSFTRPLRALFICHAGAAVHSAGAHVRPSSAGAPSFALTAAAAVDGACCKMREALHACAICTTSCHVSGQHARSCSR